jgi:hypothetical protein
LPKSGDRNSAKFQPQFDELAAWRMMIILKRGTILEKIIFMFIHI